VKVRAGNRYVERPLRELIVEALGAPILVFVFLKAMCGGW